MSHKGSSNFYYYPILFFVLFSCSREKERDGIRVTTFGEDIKVEDVLDSLQLPLDLWKVNAISSTEELLFILSTSSDTMIKVFSLRDYSYLGGFAKQGPGPEEFNNVIPSSFTAYNDQLIVTDLKSVNFFDVELSENKKGFTSKRVRQDRIIGSYIPLNMAFVLNDSTIGGHVDGTEHQYSIFNTRTGSPWSFARYPDLRDNIPQTAKYHLYQFWNALKPDRESIVSAYVNFPVLKIDHINTGEDQLIEVVPKQPQNQTIRIGPGNRSVHSFELIKYFNAIEVNDEYIVARYQEGQVVKKAIEKSGSFQWVFEGSTSPLFLLYNWDGDPIGRIELSNWMADTPYAITPTNEIIFFHPDRERVLYKINLKKVL